METQVAYTTPLKPVVTRTRKVAKSARPIPDGYMSLDEYGSIFHRKLDESYAKLKAEADAKYGTGKRMTVDEYFDKLWYIVEGLYENV